MIELLIVNMQVGGAYPNSLFTNEFAHKFACWDVKNFMILRNAGSLNCKP